MAEIPNSNEFCFIHEDVRLDWADLLLDGCSPHLLPDHPGSWATGYCFRWFSDKHRMAHIMAWVGQFKSVGEARKNGYDQPIPLGFSLLTVGKRKLSVAIVNVHPDDKVLT